MLNKTGSLLPVTYHYSPNILRTMKPILSTLLLLMLAIVSANAQFARVQVIHNAPDPTVDVYVNGTLALDDFTFRSATPFFDLPAFLPLTLAIAPGNSTSVADALASFDVSFEEGKTYAVTASGVVGGTPAFTLITDAAAQESAPAGQVALNVLHGSPDAPPVDVVVRTGDKIVSSLAYGEFTPYLTVPAGVYYLDIKPAGSEDIVVTYKADLSGLGGQAIRVLASGYLGSAPSFALIAVLNDGTVVELPATPVARVQVIHNSPNPTVDVYANGDLLLDNFAFRTATPFVYLPAGVDITLGIAPDNSTSAADAIANYTVNLVNGKTYIVTASGVVGGTPAFDLVINDNAREKATQTTNVDIAVLHGSPDAPAVDVDAVLVADNVITDLAYGEFTGYLSLPPARYDFAVRATGNSAVVASFRADLSGLAGQSAYVFASGFLDGSAGPAFGLYAALANGTVVALPLTPLARVQLIHNSPDPVVDVYAGNTLLVNDFAYRTATPYIDVPADRDIAVGIALANSTSANDAIASFDVNFAAGQTYAVTASGIVGDPTTPFTLIADADAREAALLPTQVDFNVLHGSTDAPAVDVAVVGLGDVVTNLSYGEFTPYLSVPPASYLVQIKPAGSPDVLVTYDVNLSGLTGGAARVFASGLLNGTPGFGLFAALPNGTVVEFPVYTPPAKARLQVIHNSPSGTVDVYANGNLLLDNFAYRTATPFIDVDAEVNITLAIAPENSTSAADAVFTADVTFAANTTYAVTASGIVGDPTTPFTLIADADAREAALLPTQVDFNVLHGSTDAPAVDVAVVGLGDVVTNLSYGEFTPYLSVPPASYLVQIKPAGSPDVLVTYDVNLSGLTGGAARVFASGLLNGTPGFGLFAALPNGTVVEFPVYTPPSFARVQLIHNCPSAPLVDLYINGELAADDFAFRTATPFDNVPANTPVVVSVAPSTSTSVNDAIASFNLNFDAGKTYIVTASGLIGSPVTPFTLIVNDNARESALDPGQVDVAVLHGSTNAPAVDVDAVFVANNVISNLAYGQFTDYLNLPPDVYDLAVRASGSPDVAASFRADLSGLAGQSAYVFASGFINGVPSFGLYAALPNGTVVALPLTPVTRVQIVHNSPSPTVDVYAGNTRLLDDFAFRTATPFVTIPADRNINIGVAPDNSASAADAIAVFPVNFESNKSYTVFASGVVGSTERPFTLLAQNDAQEFGAPGLVQVSVHHGSPTPGPIVVDVDERLLGNILSNFDYGDFSPYLSLPPDNYYFDIRPAGSETILATYQADLTGLSGQALRVFASGILGGAPGFGLFAVLANGTVVELPAVQVARVQVIHNSPSPTVDVYANDGLLIDDFEFQTATPFFYVPAGVPLNIGVAPASSQSAAEAIANFPVTFDNGKTYVVIAGGLVGGTPGFNLFVSDAGRERTEDPNLMDLMIFHGSPGAPNVDVTPVGADLPLVSDLAFGEFTPYVSLVPDTYLLDVSPAGAPNTIVGTWGGDFSGLEGLVGVVFATGILNSDPEFDLLLALPDGTVIPLPSFARAQVIHNSPQPVVDVYFDDIQILDDFEFRQATPFGFLPARVPFTLGVAAANSTSSSDAIYTLDVDGLETGKSYVIMAAGVVGGTPSFGLFISENGRDRALTAGTVDLALFHGSPDAPEVDVQLPAGPVIFDNIEFGEFSNYLSVPPSEYVIQLTPSNDNATIVKSYVADIAGLTGQAATVFASGYLSGDPGFEVWVALADGTTFPLPEFVNTNELDDKLASVQLAPNPASEETWLRLALNESEALRYRLFDATGRLAQEGELGSLPAGETVQRLDVSALSAGMYYLELRSDAGVRSVKLAIQR